MPHSHLDSILQFSGSCVCDNTLTAMKLQRTGQRMTSTSPSPLLGTLKLCFFFVFVCLFLCLSAQHSKGNILFAWKIVAVDHGGVSILTPDLDSV